jgi:hypothetical protein
VTIAHMHKQAQFRQDEPPLVWDVVDDARGPCFRIKGLGRYRTNLQGSYIARITDFDRQFEFKRIFLQESVKGNHCYLTEGLKPNDIIEVSLTRSRGYKTRDFFLILVVDANHISVADLTKADVVKRLRGEAPKPRYQMVPINFCRDTKTGRWAKRDNCPAVAHRQSGIYQTHGWIPKNHFHRSSTGNDGAGLFGKSGHNPSNQEPPSAARLLQSPPNTHLRIPEDDGASKSYALGNLLNTVPKESHTCTQMSTLNQTAIDSKRPIYVSDVCGPSWWGALHGVVDSISCESCRDHGQDLMSAMHDFVNIKLGKELYDPVNFRHVADEYHKAAHPGMAQEPSTYGLLDGVKVKPHRQYMGQPGPGCAGIAEAVKKLAAAEKAAGLLQSNIKKQRINLGVAKQVCDGQTSFAQSYRERLLAAACAAHDDEEPQILPSPVLSLGWISWVERESKKAGCPVKAHNGKGETKGHTILTAVAQSRMNQPTIRISGKCSEDDCSITIKGSHNVSSKVTGPAAIASAIDEIRRKLAEKQTMGNPATFAIGSNGVSKYEFQFAVVPLSDLIASHDPFRFEVNPNYPQELQPRLRDRAATRVQVEKMAANLEPDSLLTDFRTLDRGAPIVGSDMVVESGNGRTMALQLASEEYPDVYRAYVEKLGDVASAYGVEGQLTKTKTPALVRIRMSEVNRREFAQEANTSAAISASGIEMARTDADKISLEMLNGLVIGETESIEDALRATRNRAFVTSFVRKLPETEQARLVDSNGNINQDAIRRMVMGVFVSVFQSGDGGLRLAEMAFESTDLEIRNVINGISRAMGPLAVAESLTREELRDPGLAIGNDLSRSINAYASIKRTAGMTVEKYLAQSQMFQRELDPFEETILVDLAKRSRSAKKIGALLRRYAVLVEQSPPPNQGSLIDLDLLAKEDLWKQAVATADAEDLMPGLFGNLRVKPHPRRWGMMGQMASPPADGFDDDDDPHDDPPIHRAKLLGWGHVRNPYSQQEVERVLTEILNG